MGFRYSGFLLIPIAFFNKFFKSNIGKIFAGVSVSKLALTTNYSLLNPAEGEGFEPSTPVTQGKHLAGARTRPLCDPSAADFTIT